MQEDRRDGARFQRGTATLNGLRGANLTNDLGLAAFRPFFLRYGIIGALQSRLATIGARLLAVASHLKRHAISNPVTSGFDQQDDLAHYLPAVATVAGAFRLIGHDSIS